jgi:hypothetical protein
MVVQSTYKTTLIIWNCHSCSAEITTQLTLTIFHTISVAQTCAHARGGTRTHARAHTHTHTHTHLHTHTHTHTQRSKKRELFQGERTLNQLDCFATHLPHHVRVLGVPYEYISPSRLPCFQISCPIPNHDHRCVPVLFLYTNTTRVMCRVRSYFSCTPS